MAALRRSIAQVKWKYIRELCLSARQLSLAGLTALPASTTALESNPKNRPRRTAVGDNRGPHPPCDMPRSERCRIRGNCLHGIALPSPAQAPASRRAPDAGGAPGDSRAARRRAAHRARASRRTGSSLRRPLGGFGRAVESRPEGLRTVAKAWARGRRSSDKAEREDDRVRASRGAGRPGGDESLAQAA
jgi:hypothetical protein